MNEKRNVFEGVQENSFGVVHKNGWCFNVNSLAKTENYLLVYR